MITITSIKVSVTVGCPDTDIDPSFLAKIRFPNTTPKATGFFVRKKNIFERRLLPALSQD